jgi:hypothetical protein
VGEATGLRKAGEKGMGVYWHIDGEGTYRIVDIEINLDPTCDFNPCVAVSSIDAVSHGVDDAKPSRDISASLVRVCPCACYEAAICTDHTDFASRSVQPSRCVSATQDHRSLKVESTIPKILLLPGQVR